MHLVLGLPRANPAPEAAAFPGAQVQFHVSGRDANKDIFHVYKCVKFDFPIVPRMAAGTAAEAHSAKHRLEVDFVLLVRCETVVQELQR